MLSTQRYRVPLAATLTYCVVAALGIALGLHITAGELGRQASLANDLFRWDSNAYLSIAEHGYIVGSRAATVTYDYNAAFFPGYAVIELLLGHVVGWSPIWMILPAFGLGVLSIFTFHSLANRFLTGRELALCTFGFALYPGASFMVAAYPVTALNLCTIFMILALLGKRPGRAAIWGGIGSLFGPLGVVVALVVPAYVVMSGLRTGRREPASRSGHFRAGLRFALLLLVDFSGGLAVVVYQGITLGNPFALLKAQAHWGSASLFRELEHALTLYPLRAYYGHPWVGTPGHPPFNGLEIYLQSVGSIVAMFTILALVLAQRRLTPWYLTAVGVLVLLAYYWFDGSVIGAVAGWRLLYIAVPAFLGIGVAGRRRWRLMVALVSAFGVVMLIQVALTVAGYFVV